MRNEIKDILNPAVEVTFHNEFDIVVESIETGRVRKEKAYNVVLDNYFKQMIPLGMSFNYIVYGCGAGIPSPSDTELFQHSGGAHTGDWTMRLDSDNSVVIATTSITLGLTTANGVTITEVGLASTPTGENLTTHAMLKDMNGNQISITKTELDILTIYATVYIRVQHHSNIEFSPTALGYVAGVSNPLTHNWWSYLSGIHHCSGPIAASGRVVDATNKTITFKSERQGPAEVNYPGGIVSISDQNYIHVRFDLDNVDPGRVIKETLGTGDGINKLFKTKFYGCRNNPIVYVDGVETSAVLIHDRRVSQYPEDAWLIGLMHRIHPDGRRHNVGFISNGGHGLANVSLPLHEWTYVEWPPYLVAPLKSITVHDTDYSEGLLRYEVEGCNDLISWRRVTQTNQVLAEGDSYRYYRIKPGSPYTGTYPYPICKPEGYLGNVEFITPPPVGAIITIDYTPRAIPKDDKHVLDFELSNIKYGPWS